MKNTLTACILTLSLAPQYARAETVKSGLCDLSLTTLDDTNPTLKLTGHWFFAKNKFLSLKDLDRIEQKTDPDPLVPVPSRAENIAETTYGTYYCQLILPKTNEELGLSITYLIGATRVAILDASRQREYLISSYGKISNDRSQQVIAAVRQIGHIPRDLDTHDKLYLIIQASNIPRSVILSESPEIGLYWAQWDLMQKSVYEAFFVVGMLMLLAVVNLLLYGQRREDKASLCIGLFALLAAMRQLSTDALWAIIFPKAWLGGLSILSLFIAVTAVQTLLLLFLSFLRANFSEHVSRRLLLGLWVWNITGSLVYFTFDLFNLWIGFFGTLILATIGAIAWGLFASIRARQRGAILALVGILILFAGFINDIVVYALQLNWRYLAQYGFIVFIVMQSTIVAKNFSYAFRTAERLSRDLALEVEKQTRNIKLILRNIREGIFTIAPGQKLGLEYSDHLVDILENPQIAQQALGTLLLNKTNLSHDDRARITSTLDFCLGESSLNFALNADTFVDEFVFHAPSGDKIIKSEWAPVINEKTDTTEQILVTLRDITSIKALEAQAIENAKTIRIITEIIEITPEKFTSFIASCRNFLDENRRLLDSADEFDADILKILFINMHTMKGAARSYRLKSMTEVMHNAEQSYAFVQKNRAEWNLERMRDDLGKVEAIFTEYEQVWREKLGRKIDQKTFEIDMDTLKKSIQIVHEMQNLSNFPAEFTPMVDSLRATFYELYYKKAESVFSLIFEDTPRLARDLNKEVPHISCHLQGLGLTQDGVDLIHNIFGHLIRNSLDHGIETSAERIECQKPVRGTLTLSCKKVDQRCLIEFSDDGRGLNLDRIRAIALENKILNVEEAKDRHKIASLIFHSGFSTCKKINDISGRGVGMAAVKQYLDDAGGSISINFQSDKKEGFVPFCFYIYLPPEAFRFFDDSDWAKLGEAHKAA